MDRGRLSTDHVGVLFYLYYLNCYYLYLECYYLSGISLKHRIYCHHPLSTNFIIIIVVIIISSNIIIPQQFNNLFMWFFLYRYL